MKRNLIFCSIIVLFFSCKENNENTSIIEHQSTTETEKKDNVTTQISTDSEQLQKLIDLSEFKPEKIKFKYKFIDNSKGRVPGPSDYSLEAILYFDDETMEKIWKIDKNADFPNPNYQKQDFKFNWLDKQTISELEKSDGLKNAHPDLIFGTNNGKCWYLKNKILFRKETN